MNLRKAGWSNDEIRSQLRRMQLPLKVPKAPVSKRLGVIEKLLP